MSHRPLEADVVWMQHFPTMIRNALIGWNLRTEESVRVLVANGEIRKVNNIGTKSFTWLCAYFGIEKITRPVIERVPLARNRCPKCGFGW